MGAWQLRSASRNAMSPFGAFGVPSHAVAAHQQQDVSPGARPGVVEVDAVVKWLAGVAGEV